MTAVLILAAVFVLAAAGCWFGAPPEEQKAIVRDVRREWAIRRWQREQRKAQR